MNSLIILACEHPAILPILLSVSGDALSLCGCAAGLSRKTRFLALLLETVLETADLKRLKRGVRLLFVGNFSERSIRPLSNIRPETR